jgi:hypothetical protein
MERTGWEHHDLEKEIFKCNVAQLLELFKRESQKYIAKCAEYTNGLGRLTEEGKKELQNEAILLAEGRDKVALAITEILTDTKQNGMRIEKVI